MLDNSFLVGLNVVLACFALYYRDERNDIQEKVNTKAHEILKEAEASANKIMAEANDRERVVKEFIEMKGKDYPILAKVIADYKNARDFAEAHYIVEKRRLVPETREKIRFLTEKNRDLLAEIQALKWKLEHIVSICPNIEEIFDDSNIENFVNNYSASIIRKAHELYEQKVSEGNEYYNECIKKSEAKSNEVKKLVEDLLSKKIKEYPIISSMLADYFTAKDAAVETRLTNKKPQALKAAEEVRIIRAEKRKLIAENLAYKWELEYIRNLVPWIDEIEDESIVPESDYINPDYQSDDGAGHWLSPEEYNTLPVVEKYQLALDRYRNRRKSRAEIGREYERYIGYLYEQEGYNVEYFGIQQGLEDMGRDLICKKGDVIHVVQCKCWSNKKQKVIHEKHINQLYGTTVMYELETGNADGEKNDSLFEITKEIVPFFYSTVNCNNKLNKTQN